MKIHVPLKADNKRLHMGQENLKKEIKKEK